MVSHLLGFAGSVTLNRARPRDETASVSTVGFVGETVRPIELFHSMTSKNDALNVPMPRLRFTLRAMMIAVFAAALVFGLEATRRRWAFFRAMAKDMSIKATQCRTMAGAMDLASNRGPAAERRENALKAAEYSRLADELERASKDLRQRW
jgi:hypothetical protein